MLDEDLARLYQVTTKSLNQAIRRNLSRFPSDFMFQLADSDAEILRSQIVTSKKPGRGGRRNNPFAFTEYGVAMLSSVLRSERAIQVNIAIMRTFGNLRALGRDYTDLAKRLIELERKHDQDFKSVVEAIRQIIAASNPPARKKISALEPKD